MGNMCSMIKDMRSDSDAKFEKMSEAFIQMRYEGQFRFDKMDERFTIREARMDKIRKTKQRQEGKKEWTQQKRSIAQKVFLMRRKPLQRDSRKTAQKKRRCYCLRNASTQQA